jgi:aryl-alcohol dehydrogenase-like predicted oxidoreductase
MCAAVCLFDERALVLGIGTAALTIPYGAPGMGNPAPNPAAARRTLQAAVERGVRFIDTAPAYGESETLVGRALGDREDCVIATKLAIPAAGWGALSAAEASAHVRACAEASLRALRRDRLDLLQIHNADRALISGGAVVEALAELRAQGLVRSVGATVYGETNALAAIADPVIDVVQIAFNALDRRPERRVLPAAARAGTAVIARSLLLHGVLTPAGRDLDGPFAALGAAADVVRQALGVTWQQLPGAAVAFVANRPGVACALLGPRDEHELTALLDGAERFRVSASDVQLPAIELPDRLLDPSRWPAEVALATEPRAAPPQPAEVALATEPRAAPPQPAEVALATEPRAAPPQPAEVTVGE